jgi:futalosine hydrolase
LNITLVSATPFEVAPTIQWLESLSSPGSNNEFTIGSHRISVLVTGVGPVATTWKLAGYLSGRTPDLVINAGIAGAYDRSLALGEVVLVGEEQLADTGAEESDGRLISLFDMNLLDPDEFPYRGGRLVNPDTENVHFLRQVRGLTVSRATGTEASISALTSKYPDAQTESMEGAAVFYCCLLSGVRFLEIRSVSNYVEPRNRAGWNIPLAISSLNDVLKELLQTV